MSILDKFDNLLIKIFNLAHHHHKVVLLFFGLLFTTSLFFIPNLQFHITTERLLEKNSITYERLEKTSNDFPIRNSLYLLFEQETPFESKQICLINKWLRNEVHNNHEISVIRTPLLLRRVDRSIDKITYPLLINDPCENKPINIRNEFAKLINTPWHKLFVDETNTKFGVEILFYDTIGGTPYGDFNPNILHGFKNNLTTFTKNNFTQTNVHFIGHMGQFFYGLQGVNQTQILNVLISIILIFISKIFFGTYRSGFLLVLTLTIMGIIIYGGMAATETPIDSLSVGLFLILTISVIEDFVFLTTWKMNHHEDTVTNIFKKFITPCFLTSLTTILGFGSLCFTDLTIIKRFGLWAAAGSFVEWMLVFFFLPAFIKQFSFFSYWTNNNVKWFTRLSIKLLKKRLPKNLIKIFLLISVLGFFSLWQLKIADSPFEIFPSDHPFRIGLHKLEQGMGWQASFDIIFEDKEQEAFNKNVLKNIAKHSVVSRIHSPYDIEDFYVNDLPQLSKKLVLTEYSLVPEYKRYVSSDKKLHAVVFVKANKVEIFDTLVKDIERWCNDGTRCYATGEIIAFSDIAMKIPRVLTESFLYSILLVSALLVFLLFQVKKWSAHNMVALIISCLWGPLLMILVFVILRIPLNFITCVFVSVLVGLTGDNAIQFIFAAKDTAMIHAVNEQGIGALSIAVITLVSSIVFLFSYFSSMKTLGLLVATGIVLMNIGDIWIFKEIFKNIED